MSLAAILLGNIRNFIYVIFSDTKDNALHTAVKHNLPEMVALLLYYGYKDNQKNKTNHTAQEINETSYLEGWEILQGSRATGNLCLSFLQSTLPIFENNFGDATDNLFNAIKINNADLVRQALAQGANLSIKSYQKYNKDKRDAVTPAFFAAETSQWEALGAIVSSCQLNDNGSFRFETALLCAIASKQLPLAANLLRRIQVGVDNFAYFDGTKHYALHVAVQHNLPEMVALLLYYGYQDNKKNAAGQTAQEMNAACYLKGWEILQSNRANNHLYLSFIEDELPISQGRFGNPTDNLL